MTTMVRAASPFTHFARLWLAAVLAIALAGSALAHRAAPNTADLALAQFLAAGGTMDDLCHDDHAPGHAADTGCDACRLIGAALVTPAPVLAPFQTAPCETILWSHSATEHPRAPPLSQSARAPPAI